MKSSHNSDLAIASVAMSGLGASMERGANSIEAFGKFFLANTANGRMRLAPRQHRFRDYVNLSAAEFRRLRGLAVKNKPAGSKLARMAREQRVGIGHPR